MPTFKSFVLSVTEWEWEWEWDKCECCIMETICPHFSIKIFLSKLIYP